MTSEYPTTERPVLLQCTYDFGVTFIARQIDFDISRFYGHVVAVFRCKPKNKL
jgi:hypothetical protein